jgi:hypothetical protein
MLNETFEQKLKSKKTFNKNIKNNKNGYEKKPPKKENIEIEKKIAKKG